MCLSSAKHLHSVYGCICHMIYTLKLLNISWCFYFDFIVWYQWQVNCYHVESSRGSSTGYLCILTHPLCLYRVPLRQGDTLHCYCLLSPCKNRSMLCSANPAKELTHLCLYSILTPTQKSKYFYTKHALFFLPLVAWSARSEGDLYPLWSQTWRCYPRVLAISMSHSYC